MEKINRYRQIIRQTLEAYARPSAQYPANEVENVLIMDEERGHYQLMTLGWHNQKRIKWLTLYLRLKGNQIWIEHDATENGIADELREGGVSPTDIIFAFHAPELRQHVAWAAA